MFKFIKQYAETIQGAQVYPMISLLIFFIFFVVLLAYVRRVDKNRVNELSKIPFDQETEQSTNI